MIMPSLEINTLIFQRYLIGRWHMGDYTIVTFQAVSELRPLGSIDSTPYVDAGPSQAAVQNVILIDSGARADVRSMIMSFDLFRQTFIYIRSPAPSRVNRLNTLRRCWSFAGGGAERDPN